jgi:hypothetical protein
MRSLLLVVTLLYFSIASAAGNLGGQFVTAKLAYGASIDLPRSWQVMRGNEMRAIETVVGAAIDLSGYASLVDGTGALLVSTFPDPRLYAGVTVTSVELRGSTRLTAATLSEGQLRSGDLTIRQGMEATLARFGAKAWGWTPLKPITLARTTVLHISYLRSSDVGDRRVHIYKFFGTGRIFDVAVSTSVVAEDKLNSL